MPGDLEMTQEGVQSISGFEPPADPPGQSESLSPDNLTLEGNVEGTEAASPETLAEEYKPYSQFPWHNIPDEARGEFLEKLKKFHGDMTRSSQDTANLRKEVDEYRQKAQWFDSLTAEKWFQDAYQNRTQAGQPSNQPPPAQTGTQLNDLSEYGLEQPAMNAIQQAISNGISQAVGPLTQELDNMRRNMLTDQTEREMAELRVQAQSKGWPSPDDKLSQISKLIQDGRARSLRDAYHLSVFEEIPSLVENQAKLALDQELRSKEAALPTPAFAPPEVPGEQVFTGEDAVVKALNASISELNTRAKANQLGR